MKVVFLDRDGVINAFPGHGLYVTKIKEFHFLPGALRSLAQLTQEGYALFVISNQAGVSKGIYSPRKLKQINDFMMRHVRKAGAKIKKVFYCTHRSDEECDCRKPRIGSVKRALGSMRRTLSHAKNAYFVGDDKVDIEAGRNAGCKTILVLSGKNRLKDTRSWAVKPDHVVKSLKEATEVIIHENTCHSRHGRRRAP